MDFAHLDARELAVSFESSLDTKELVKQAVDIVELVGKHIQLRRQGRNYVGLCPWHEDSRPSLQVNPERQSFKCWVCDIGGDVFSFVMKIEGVEFREALAMLADQAGIALGPARRRRISSAEGPEGFVEGGEVFASGGEAGQVVTSAEGKRPLYRAMAWAEEQYHDCLLNSPDAEPARKYLDDRGITPESIGKFHVGFSPNRGDWLQSLVQGNSARLKTLETVGLLGRSSEGDRLYDRFRGRLLFSIRDVQDRPVGFGGRVIPGLSDSSPAKYVNSPETPLFAKSKLLYGHDLARRAMRKTRRALVMEGYTDCIIAHQHGFEDAVAVLGTALGPRHVQILKRFADRIVLVLDGDEAGQRRANEVLELFVSENVDLRILTLPEGSDPCDFLQEHGAEAFDDLVNTRAVDALEHAFGRATRGIDVENDVHNASQALERMVSIVAKAPRLRADSTRDDRFRQEKILQRLAASFRVPEEDVRRRLTTLRRAARRRPVVRSHDEVPHDLINAELGNESGGEPGAEGETSAPVGQIDPWQRELLEILVSHPGCLPTARAVVTSEWLEFPPCRRIYETFCQLADAGEEPSFDRLMLVMDDPATKSLLVELDEKGRAKGLTDPEDVLKELMGSFRRREAEKKRPAVTGALRQRRFDDKEELDVLRKIREQEQARHGISEPTDG